MSNADWLTIEKLVQLIEKSIDKDSTVEHNVRLSDLTSKTGKKRQCDLVITSGKAPRHTKTIVEIQSRTSKFNITFFHGLIQKMKDVGAQHLICVSTVGFTQAIKEETKDMGGTVRLITLKKYDTEKIPFNFFKFTLNHIEPIYTQSAPLKLVLPKSLYIKNIKIDEAQFTVSLCGSQLFSLPQLISYYFKENKSEPGYTYDVKLPFNEGKIKLLHDKKLYNVSIEGSINVQNKTTQVPVSIYDYNQEDSGSIAWALEGSFIRDGLMQKVILNVLPCNESEFLLMGIQFEFHEVGVK